MASRLKRSGAVLAAAVALVSAWEGVKLAAYPDRFADGLPTVCFGETGREAWRPIHSRPVQKDARQRSGGI